MTDEFNSGSPIYLQLANRISKQIIRKELLLGEKLPSVREMAIKSGVNPNTVQRTYNELERMGIVETKRGQGTFVSENQQNLIGVREGLKEDLIGTFIKEMKEMGFTFEDILNGLKSYASKNQGVNNDD